MTKETEEIVFANDISNYLCQCYPNHKWGVCVDIDGGIVKIIEADAMDPTIPYVIRIKDFGGSVKILQRMVRTAGGEILERLRISRERQTRGQIITSITQAKKDLRGNLLIDTSNAPNWVG